MDPTNVADEVEQVPSGDALAAVAAERGCTPAELVAPLYEAVDADAFDAILGRGDANHDVYVGFTLGDNGAQVHGDGTVYADGERSDSATGTVE